MAGGTAAGQAGVVHPPTQESTGVGVAGFARQQRRKVIYRFAYNTGRLGVVAGYTITDYADMFKTFDQEAGRALMAGITWLGCLNMVNGLRSGADTCPDGMATSAIFRSVLEDTIDVALFAPQGGMHVSEQEAGFRVVKRGDAGGRFRLNQAGKAKHHARQHHGHYFADPIIVSLCHAYLPFTWHGSRA